MDGVTAAALPAEQLVWNRHLCPKGPPGGISARRFYRARRRHYEVEHPEVGPASHVEWPRGGRCDGRRLETRTRAVLAAAQRLRHDYAQVRNRERGCSYL